ncbi:uncharacterized protein LOC116196331 [Punica granatum]|uniref:Polymerase nucleotidyl transferase domain-containing protein n=2 Tax=Punica granatum TaxID=22663 RepID=A0A218W846_PUNGR|nr:uncharacterized protein LOC116196331 [Punica granatum]OWM68659.1 hypothetical protein CDL15_Pgr023624 [Punica granatum]PKI76672.1 hypothetical protein CRG98_002981 [Punica granatum]
MGKHEEWAQPPSGLLPNGLLPGEAASVTRVLDLDRWSKAEERTAELIACIQPNQPSEERRNAVADYVQRLIVKCFPCQVFTFGSVPLKTYLPDGDIDLTAFSENRNLKDTWAHQVRDILESEEKNENAEFRVKEVQYIQAEVKIIKCLVENIVVDISFNQLGGLCTLCFLEEVDNLINQEHLFKRSIILIKAWCYYESRILGAHHGLISTYALETLVLYIFHIFNKKFVGPLEVLYRFLEFFSKFDWDNFCVSLRGPVPIGSLPDVTAEPPRKDDGDLVLNKRFLDACSSVYAVFPGGQENQGQAFISKHFNVIDPLRVNNNLGRSVSRGNFFRIRSAFAFGAKKLARLLDCPKDHLLSEIDDFFTNTWDRHGSGHRPDAPRNDLRLLRLHSTESLNGSENQRNSPSSRKGDVSYSHESQIEGTHGSLVNHPSESVSRTIDASLSRAHTQKNYGNLNNSRADHFRRETSSKQGFNMNKDQRSSRADMLTDIQGRYLFARTHSSPELTDSYSEVSYQGRRSRVPESGKNQTNSARVDGNRRKNLELDIVRQDAPSCPDDSSFGRHVPSQQSIDATVADSISVSDSYREDDARLGVVGEEFASVSGAQGMHQEQQDFMNMMASSPSHGFNDQLHMPLNLPSGHLPLNLLTMGYAQRNLAGMVPTNIPMIETPWGTNVPFPHGLVAPPLAHYFPNVGVAFSAEESLESGDQNFNSAAGASTGEADHSFWHDQDQGSAEGFDLDNGNFEALHTDEHHQHSTATSNSSIPSSRMVGSGSYRAHQRSIRENRITGREDHSDASFHQGSRENEVYLDDRSAASSRSIRSTHSSSIRSKTSSESSWDGSSAKASRSSREKRGRKGSSSAVPSTVYGKGKNLSEHASAPTDDDSRDWNQASTGGTEMTSPGPQPVASLQVAMQHQMASFEPAQAGGSDSVLPMGPVLLGPGSRQRPGDNSKLIAFYPTGPPVPFVAMLPVYNFPSETGSAEASTSQFSREDGLDNSNSGPNFDSTGRGHHPEAVNVPTNSLGQVAASPGELSEHKSDILNSDFASHWHNLQYGRFCQDTHFPPPLVYPSSPGVMSPVYLQGRVPWDSNTARPISGNTNLFTQLMGYGPPRFVPVAPFQPVSNGPASIYHVDEMPRYRSGTGTYLPNPIQKVSPRERHSSNTRRGNYGFERSDHHSDREGNWNSGPKSRASGRGHSRNQADRPTLRPERVAPSESQSERPWSSSYRQNSFSSSYHSQNGPIHSSAATQGGPSNLAQYGMYPLPAMNPNAVSSNGATLPPVVMFYPYDHYHGTGYSGSPVAEQLEFGSLGEVDFQGVNDMLQLTEGSHRSSGPPLEEQMFHGSPAPQSSPDQPSSPQLRR